MEKSHKARYPLNYRSMISLFIPLLITVSILLNDHPPIILKMCWILSIILTVVQIIVAMYWWSRKPFTVWMRSNELVLGDRVIPILSIKDVTMDGRTVGIRRYTDWIVPIRQCFVFTQNELAYDDFRSWAKDQRLEMRNRSFTRWI